MSSTVRVASSVAFVITLLSLPVSAFAADGRAGELAAIDRGSLAAAGFQFVHTAAPDRGDAKQAMTPEAAARVHLGATLMAAKRSAEATQRLTVHSVDSLFGDAQLVQFDARIDGIEIFRENVAVLMDREQRLVAVRGALPQVDDAKGLPTFQLDAAQAVGAALQAYGFVGHAAKQLTVGEHRGEFQQLRMQAGAIGKHGASVAANGLRARRVYFRVDGALQPAWYVETQVAPKRGAASDYYAHVISAVDGRTLFRMNQSADVDANTYRVWAENSSEALPLPSPEGRASMPDPDGLPAHNVVPFLTADLRSLGNGPFSRSATDGWLPTGANVTTGNNVDVYVDLVAPDGFSSGDIRPTATAPNTFDFLFDNNLNANANANQRQAVAVQMFYWVNWLHDAFYDHGFAEANGNAQLDNFGRGGFGGDRILSEAQDYDVADNANMSTPSDGVSPRMQMGLFTNPTLRDSGLDGTVVAHEWAHYLSNRLVFNGSGLNTTQASGLGEGWSDFVALLSLVKDEDRQKPGNANFNAPYAIGGYSALRSYYGLRRYPYSTELAKNPLSLRHTVDNVPLPSSPAPRYGAAGTNNVEVHAQGEVWASALWDCYTGLLNDRPRLSFAVAQSRMKDYLVGGLKLTPASPTMIDARDALLATIAAGGDGNDFAICSAAFARRGMGAGALIDDGRRDGSVAITVESALLGSDVAATALDAQAPTGCDFDSVLDVGETQVMTFTLRNTGFTALPSASVTLSANRPEISFPYGNRIDLGAVPLFGTISGNFVARLDSSVPPNTPVTITITPDAPGINGPPGISTAQSMRLNFDNAPRTATTETFDESESGWLAGFLLGGAFETGWAQRSEGATQYLHGSDETGGVLNELRSPTMSVGTAPLIVTLRHRYTFESDSTTAYDGGVVQTSIDGGVTWVDVDPLIAGYGPGTLSDCCTNPYAGKRGYLKKSAGYPAFSERVLNFGTAFANQTNFRFRFVLATDAAVNAGGWDIDNIAVTGLNDTPFTTIVAQSASCAGGNRVLQGGLSGTWYAPERSGEGVLVDFAQVGATPVVFFTWYTYDGGVQRWLAGSSAYSLNSSVVGIDLISTRGANFGSAFHPADVVRTPWGNVELTFPDCNTMTLQYQKTGGESGTQTLRRTFQPLAVGQCPLLQGGLTGTWYSTSRSGEGVLVDFAQVNGTPVEFFTWYNYEGGNQQWLAGSQVFNANDPSVAFDLISTRGASFGSAFRPQDVVRTPWGSVSQRFTDCNTMELSYQKTGGESGVQVLTRALARSDTAQCH